MSRIAQVVSTERISDGDGEGLDVTVDAGDVDPVIVPHFGGPGDDAVPLPGDFVALTDSSGSGAEQAVGYADVANAGVAAPGERRLYARNAAGEVTAVVWMRNNGDVEISSTSARVTIVGSGALSPIGVSRSDLVDARLDALESALASLQSLYNAHIHPHPLGPTSPTASLSTPPVAPGQPTGSGVLFSE